MVAVVVAGLDDRRTHVEVDAMADAEGGGLVVRRARWAPVSAGEYDRRTRTVSVNLAVVDQVHARYGHDRTTVAAAIVAHERVHVLSTDAVLPHEEERQARLAAIEAAGAEVVVHIDAVLAEAWA